LHYFPDDGSLFQNWLIETPAAVIMGAAFVGQVGNLLLRIGLHKLIAIGAGIVCDRHTDGPDTLILLHSFERHRCSGKQTEVSFTIITDKCIIG
jgi:hypothetical protein